MLLDQKIILIAILFQIPFQDFFLNQTPLGVFGSNMSLITIDLFFIFIFLTRLDYLKISKKYFMAFLVSLVITFIFLLFSDFFIKNTNLIVKAVNNLIIYLQTFIVFYVFNYFYKTNSSLIKVSINMSLYIFLFLFGYLLLSSYEIFTLDTNSILHGMENSNMKPRLFSLESSRAITVFITFGVIASMRFDNIYFKIFIILCIMYGSVLLQSKGGFLTLLLVSIWSLGSLKLKYRLVLIFSSMTLLALGFSSIMSYLPNVQSIEEYTTFSTRLTMMLAAIISLFYYPLGSGLGAYLTFFDSNIIEAKKVTEMIFGYFGLVPNFSELNTYLSSASAYSAKSVLFDAIMHFGWFGLMLFVYLHYQIYRKIGINLTLKILFFFLLIAHSTFTDSLFLYQYWFAFALIYNYWRMDVKKNISYSE